MLILILGRILSLKLARLNFFSLLFLLSRLSLYFKLFFLKKNLISLLHKCTFIFKTAHIKITD